MTDAVTETKLSSGVAMPKSTVCIQCQSSPVLFAPETLSQKITDVAPRSCRDASLVGMQVPEVHVGTPPDGATQESN